MECVRYIQLKNYWNFEFYLLFEERQDTQRKIAYFLEKSFLNNNQMSFKPRNFSKRFNYYFVFLIFVLMFARLK